MVRTRPVIAQTVTITTHTHTHAHTHTYIYIYIYLLYFAWADQRVQPFYNYHIV